MAFTNAKRRAETIKRLNDASEIVETAMGPVEFARRGSEPYIVIVHGTPGGHMQSEFGAPLEAEGFGTITPSRAGYLRTPLETGPTFEEQGDAIAALLDVLEVDQVIVYAISGGGPCGIEFAARHPNRVKALILEVAVSTTYCPDVSTSTIEMLTSPIFGWIQGKLVQHFPRLVVSQLLKLESTLPAEDRTRVTADIMSDPDKLEMVRSFGSFAAPFDLLRTGWDNEMIQFRAIERLPFEAIRCPTLVAHGTHDADVPFIHGETSAREIPGAEFHRVEKGFHILSIGDGAEEYRRARIEFLRAHMN